MNRDSIDCRGHWAPIKSIILIWAFILFTSGCTVRIGDGDRAWDDLTGNSRHDVSLGTYKIHTIDMGAGDPVIMVHGFADSTYCWHENVLPLLDAGFRVILVDQPGMGRSEIPRAPYVFSVENQAAEVLKLANYLKLETFHLIGSSMGGGIALYMALNYPERVKKVVVFDPACYRLSDSHNILGLPGMEHLASIFGGRWTIEMALCDVYFNDELVDDVLVDEYARALNKSGYMGALIALRQEYFSSEYDRMTENYGRVASDVLIVWGDHDTWVPPDYGVKLNSQLPISRHEVITDCGHLPHQECPEAVNPLLVAFLSFA